MCTPSPLQYGTTPLMVAIEKGQQPDVVEALLLAILTGAPYSFDDNRWRAWYRVLGNEKYADVVQRVREDGRVDVAAIEAIFINWLGVITKEQWQDEEVVKAVTVEMLRQQPKEALADQDYKIDYVSELACGRS